MIACVIEYIFTTEAIVLLCFFYNHIDKVFEKET